MALQGDARAQTPAPPLPSASPPASSTPSTPAEPVAQHALLGPVLTTDGAAAKGDKELVLRRVAPLDPIAVRAREVEVALRDAAQDLGLEVDLGTALPGDGAREADLIKAAQAGHWVISPRLEGSGNQFTLRMIAVPPKSSTMLVRIEKTDGQHLAARAVVMLRDFVTLKLGTPTPAPTAEDAAPRPEDEERRSRGKPVLAASTTLFGLYTAFAIHKSSGTDDQRTLYPLLALGGGIGLGAALLAADEWNVTTGAAWTIAGGAWWGVFSGLQLAIGRDVRPVGDRYAFGLAGGLIGTTLAVTAVSVTRYDDGDAALVHSGAAFGALGGGLIDLLARGSLNAAPETGLGYGTGIGLLVGGGLAAAIRTSAQRVMLIDLGAGLGALGGASIGALINPRVFREDTPGKTRLFLGTVLGGALIGGGLSWLFTRNHTPTPAAGAKISPTVAPVFTPEGRVEVTAGLAGAF